MICVEEHFVFFKLFTVTAQATFPAQLESEMVTMSVSIIWMEKPGPGNVEKQDQGWDGYGTTIQTF